MRDHERGTATAQSVGGAALLVFACSLAVVTVGCIPGPSGDDSPDTSGANEPDTTSDAPVADSSDSETTADVSSDSVDTEPDVPGDTADDAMVTDGDGESTGDTDGDSHCPTDTLPSQTSFVYEGSTIGQPNLFDSGGLMWHSAGDDALAWEVPETGTYDFSMTAGQTELICGVSIEDSSNNFWTPTSTCPPEGQVGDVTNAVLAAHEEDDGSKLLPGGETLLLLVSCAENRGSDGKKEADYELSIAKR